MRAGNSHIPRKIGRKILKGCNRDLGSTIFLLRFRAFRIMTFQCQSWVKVDTNKNESYLILIFQILNNFFHCTHLISLINMGKLHIFFLKFIQLSYSFNFADNRRHPHVFTLPLLRYQSFSSFTNPP